MYAFPQQHFGATANIFTTRATMGRVGAFDARLMSGGDREWGQRVHAAGLPVLYAPDVVVCHPARRTFREHAGRLRRVLGGIEDQRGAPVPLTPRMVPGHLIHVTRQVVRRLPPAPRLGTVTQ